MACVDENQISNYPMISIFSVMEEHFGKSDTKRLEKMSDNYFITKGGIGIFIGKIE